MQEEVIFEELGREERILLLKAFGYDVDEEDFIISPAGSRIPSDEMPSMYLKVEDSMIIPGSMKVTDGTPTAISKFIRERVEMGVIVD